MVIEFSVISSRCWPYKQGVPKWFEGVCLWTHVILTTGACVRVVPSRSPWTGSGGSGGSGDGSIFARFRCVLQCLRVRVVPKSGLTPNGTPTWTLWGQRRSKWTPQVSQAGQRETKFYIYKLFEEKKGPCGHAKRRSWLSEKKKGPCGHANTNSWLVLSKMSIFWKY